MLKNVIKTANTTCGIIARKAIANTNLIANIINSFISSPLFRYYNTQVSNVNISLDKIKTQTLIMGVVGLGNKMRKRKTNERI